MHAVFAMLIVAGTNTIPMALYGTNIEPVQLKWNPISQDPNDPDILQDLNDISNDITVMHIGQCLMMIKMWQSLSERCEREPEFAKQRPLAIKKLQEHRYKLLAFRDILATHPEVMVRAVAYLDKLKSEQQEREAKPPVKK